LQKSQNKGNQHETAIPLPFLAFAFLALTAGRAETQIPVPRPTCAPFAAVKKILLEKHNEQPVAAGITDISKNLIVLFKAADGSTWTIVLHRKDGMGCLMASGEDLTEASPSPINFHTPA